LLTFDYGERPEINETHNIANKYNGF